MSAILHLQVPSVWKMQNALSGELRDRFPPPYLMASEGIPYVADRHSLYDWMDSHLGPAMFRQEKAQDARFFEFAAPGRVATFNKLVGGVRLTSTKRNPQETCNGEVEPWQVNVYDPIHQFCYSRDTTSSSSDTKWLWYYQNEIETSDRLATWRRQEWIDVHTENVAIDALFYNAEANLFTLMQLKFKFNREGSVTTLPMFLETMPMPYWNGNAGYVQYGFDALFLFLIVRLFWSESKEMFPAVKNGWDGFMDYMQFWNFVDWISIVCGFVMLKKNSIFCDRREQKITKFSGEPRDARENLCI